MLLISSESNRANPALTDVVREMSLNVVFFATGGKFAEMMDGKSRRIVLLGASDVNEAILQALKIASDSTPFGVIVAADRSALSLSKQAEYAEQLSEFDNVEWIGRKFDYETLAAAARQCRRGMLRVSQDEVEAAFDNDELVLRYQPKVERGNAAQWHTREAEALVRWNHPVNGLMGPLEFLPEIEAFGLMRRLSEFVLREAAAQLAAWDARGLQLNSCINLASSQLGNPQLAQTYAEIVDSAGLECSRFTFEVVEQDLANPDAPHLQSITSMRKYGFRVCLDDFRIAAASLSTFDSLPFDEIKIHASALRRAKDDRIAMTVLAAITGLAHNLGMSVCAEGVEDQDMFEFLKTIECDKMQGFLISEAVIPSIIQRAYSAQSSAEEVA